MADLEKLALRRDRGYLLRLVFLLIVGLGVSAFLFGWLTGSGVGGCMAEIFGGARAPKAAPRAPQ